MFSHVFVCLSVCVQDYSKTLALISIKCVDRCRDMDELINF